MTSDMPAGGSAGAPLTQSAGASNAAGGTSSGGGANATGGTAGASTGGNGQDAGTGGMDAGGVDDPRGGMASGGDAAAVCILPCTGAAPDPDVAAACPTFDDEQACLAFTSPAFPFNCVWATLPIPPCLVP